VDTIGQRQNALLAYERALALVPDDDLSAVRDLRAAVKQPSLPDSSSLELRRNMLLAYMRALGLALVEPHFPISHDSAWPAAGEERGATTPVCPRAGSDDHRLAGRD